MGCGSLDDEDAEWQRHWLEHRAGTELQIAGHYEEKPSAATIDKLREIARVARRLANHYERDGDA